MLKNWQIFKELRQKPKYSIHTETWSPKMTKINFKLNINHQVDKRAGP